MPTASRLFTILAALFLAGVSEARSQAVEPGELMRHAATPALGSTPLRPASDVAPQVLPQHRHVWQGGLIGLAAGAGVGLLLWVSDDTCDGSLSCDIFDPNQQEPGAEETVVPWSAAGLIVGAAVGWYVVHDEVVPVVVGNAGGATELRWSVPLGH